MNKNIFKYQIDSYLNISFFNVHFQKEKKGNLIYYVTPFFEYNFLNIEQDKDLLYILTIYIALFIVTQTTCQQILLNSHLKQRKQRI